MTIPTVATITATFPTAPNHSTDSDQDFADKADAWVGNMDPFTGELNDTIADINVAGDAIDTSVAAAATSETNAAAAESAALGYKNAAQTSAANAATSETNAANSATAASASAGAAAGFTATSTTSLTIGLGSKSLTLAQSGKAFVVGDFVVIASTANPANFMTGQIPTGGFNASTGAMTVDVTGIGGSGTIASWNVALSGAPATPVTSGTLTGVLNLAATQSIASASTTDIGAANSNTVTITGTTTITALGTAPDGATRNILFSGALTLTHNATSLILPGAANITTAAGDTAEAQSLGSGNWRITRYTRANGLPTVGALRGMVKTAGFTAGLADNGAVFKLSSASAQTMAFTAAATLGPSWSCWLVSTSTGIWTVDPNASETIDGVPSYSVLPGEARLVTCDGTGFSTIIVKPFFYTMTASGTFPVLAPGYGALDGLAWGSGEGGAGSGGGNPTFAVGADAVPFRIPASKLTTTTSYTIAAPAVGSSTDAKNPGNSTSFGALVTATGAQSGQTTSFRGQVADGGSTGPKYLNPYSGGFVNSPNGLYGAAAGGGSPVPGSGSIQAAGTSVYAGAGGAHNPSGNGGAGSAPGGGGGQGGGGIGGSSGRGEIRCWGVQG